MEVLSTMRKFIPPPAFLEMPSIGVDISDTSVKYFKCVPRNRAHTDYIITHFGDIAIPDGALFRGTIVDQTKLAVALSEVKARTGIEMVRVSLPEERAYLFETSIRRDTPTKEIRSLLEFRLEENVPLSPRDAYFDYELVPAPGTATDVRVLVTAYAKETVENYYNACRTAGLVPLSFEVEAQAIARATIPFANQGIHMIVDFGKTRTGVGIVRNGVLMYTSTIEVGGADLSTAMRLYTGEVSESELTTIKNTRGLIATLEHPEITQAMREVVDTIIKEVKLRIDYWNSRYTADEDRFIESIILCGGSANMKGIQRYMTDKIGIPSYRANVWENVLNTKHEVPPINQRFSYGYATAIGLALGQYV
jgi:type IV pilus assembly protein PilM